MRHGPRADLAASVHQRLLNIRDKTGENFNLLLSRYVAERLLYRMTASGLSNQFVLKGAMLFAIWTGRPHRPTKDVDLLALRDLPQQRLLSVFQEICNADVERDGLVFDAGSIRVREIREGQVYQGKRVQLLAYLGRARINVQVDIGFGDVITPAPVKVGLPSLLGLAQVIGELRGFLGPPLLAAARSENLL